MTEAFALDKRLDRRAVEVTPPEPHLTAADFIQRAIDLRPMLRARQADCEAQGRVPQDVNDELDRLGFYRIVQPRRFGGYEMDVPTFLKVMIEISRGCSETGWVLALTAGHPMIVTTLSEEGQRDVYGPTGTFRCPAAFSPPGTAVAVEGGYRVSGSWPSASGIDIGTHLVTMAAIQDDSDPPRGIVLVLERSQFEIVDDWQVIGMRGTGSKRVVANDAFVPARRTALARAVGNITQTVLPGPRIYDNPMYSGRIGSFIIGESAAVAVGAARGALDVYEDVMRSKQSFYPPFVERSKDPEFQRQYGRALALIDTAEAALIRVGQMYMDYARDTVAGTPFDDERDQRLNLIEQQAIALAWEAVEIINRTAGTTAAIKEGQPIGRFFRNIAAINTHPALQIDRAAVNVARTHFAVPRG